MRYQVQLPRDGLNRRRVPAICPITGASESLTWRSVEFSWHPAWANAFVLLGILPGILIASLTSRRAAGELPFSGGAWWRARLGRGAMLLAFGFAVVAMIFAIPAFGQDATAIGVMLLVIGPAVPFLLWWFVLRNRTVGVVHITEDTLVLEVPSARFARALGANVPAEAGDELDKAAQQTTEAPERARCAKHESTLARWACGRCGAFFCPLCARYPTPGGQPLCSACAPGH